MKKLTKNILLLMVAIGLSNCSASYFSLDPDEESSLEMGRKIIEKENEFAYSTVSFEEYNNDNFVFHVFAYNKDQDNLIFDPADIYIKYYDEDKKPISGFKHYAVDPEEEIIKLDESIKERENMHDAVTGLNIVFSLFDTIVDLTDDDDNDAEEVLENVVIFTGNQVNEEISYENDIDYLKSNKGYWKNDVLRKSELSQKDGVEGIVYVPVNPDADYVKIYLPIGRTVHTYKFQQIAH